MQRKTTIHTTVISTHCSVREAVKLLDGNFLHHLRIRRDQERCASNVEPIPTRSRGGGEGREGEGREGEGRKGEGKEGEEREGEGRGGKGKEGEEREGEGRGGHARRVLQEHVCHQLASVHTYPQRSPYFRQSCVLMSRRYFCSKN